MEFKFFDIKIIIRKEYIVIGLLLLTILLALWGWYLRDNQVEVFSVDEKSTEQVTQGKGHNTKDQQAEGDGIVSEDSSKGSSKEMPTKEASTMPININVADKDTLILLHGIGEVKANAIIEYRKQNGTFKSIEEIKNVKGIGEATFLKLKDRIVVGTEGRKPFNKHLLK